MARKKRSQKGRGGVFRGRNRQRGKSQKGGRYFNQWGQKPRLGNFSSKTTTNVYHV